MTEHNPNQGFDGLGLTPRILEVLSNNNFITPTPIQQKSIPIALEGQDLVGIAQTGTGKTLAFGLPMIQRIEEGKGKGLILLPTRELALQVDETLQRVGKPLGLKTACLIGGAPMHLQKQSLGRNPHIVIATPGRLIDHLQQKSIGLSQVKVLVLDEADRMLDMGFAPQINTILEAVPVERQTMLFSATMPQEIMAIATKHMQNPLHIEIARAGTTAETIDQEFYIVSSGDKPHLLESILEEMKVPTLVFARTKYGAKNICARLRMRGHQAAEIHSNRSLAQRKEALQGFKSGKYQVLVATDIAARGIDVATIQLVVNYDLPDSLEDYVHRIGRTGRAGREGKAVSFAKPDQRRDMQGIERLIQKAIPQKQLPRMDERRLAERSATPERAPRDSRGRMRRDVPSGPVRRTPGGLSRANAKPRARHEQSREGARYEWS